MMLQQEVVVFRSESSVKKQPDEECEKYVQHRATEPDKDDSNSSPPAASHIVR